MRLNRPRTAISVLMAAFMLLAATTTAGAAGTGGKVHRVVLLNSADPYLPAFIALDTALRKTVREKTEERINFFAETLDMQRFGMARLEDGASALLREKYRNLQVDVVVCYGSDALDFAQRHRLEIWPDAAVVFLSASNDEVIMEHQGPGTAGVRTDPDFGPTIDLALHLRPKTGRVAVVAGASETDRVNLSHARASLERHAKGLDVDYLVGLTLRDTLAAVRALPPDAIVLYVTVFRDGSGLPRVPAQVLKQLAGVSPVPVFGIYETYLGEGVVAGAISSYEAQGSRAGEIVARILDGEDPSDIGLLSPVPANCMADWGQLARWGIDEGRLPEGCDVRLRQITVWDQYRWQILLVLAIILAQSFLIMALFLNRRRLQRAQSALQEQQLQRTEMEKNAALLQQRLTRFSRERSLGAMVTTIAHEISQPLIAIQNYAQAARRRFQVDGEDRAKLGELLGKIEGQAERAGDITRRVRSLVTSKEVHVLPISLTALVDDTITMVQPEADGVGCRIVYRPADQLPEVMADALQIQLVLVNLLSNAIQSMATRGSAAGVITIRAEPVEDGMVRVSVTDEGTGIQPEQVQHIFDLLYSDTKTGMGIGLAICLEIVTLHGGRIWYEANPAGGAIFQFTLKAAGS